MGLISALDIGASALNASQLGISVVGNNMANAATPGYARRRLELVSLQGQMVGGQMLGRGVGVGSISRQVGEALQSRLRLGIADENAALQRLNIFSQVESVLGELTGGDLSSQLNSFFGSWSELGNLTESSAVVVQQGKSLAGLMNRLNRDLTAVRSQVDGELGSLVGRARELTSLVANLNQQIVTGEIGTAEASGLRDQRDIALGELAGLMDITVTDLGDGAVDVLVGSTPIVLGSSARPLVLDQKTVGNRIEVSVRQGDNGQVLQIRAGRIGAILDSRTEVIDRTLDTLDKIAAELIFNINNLHATGRNEIGLTSMTSDRAMAIADRTLALNDPENASLSGLPFGARNGGFFVDVTNTTTGQTQRVRIDVDLDGIDANGLPGSGDDTSAQDIIDAINAIDGMNASFTPGGQIRINADAGVEFGFSEDSSGVLATMGINSYFTGSRASNIGVRASLSDEPSTLSVGRMIDGEFVANGTALEIAGILDAASENLGGQSLRASWQQSVQAIGTETETARATAIATGSVRQSLEAQRDSISGVNMDEEAIDLLQYQRQFQGAARLISVADELLRTLFSLV